MILIGLGLVIAGLLVAPAPPDQAGARQPNAPDADRQGGHGAPQQGDRHVRDFLRHVPSDAVAFAVAGNTREALAGVDAFIRAVAPDNPEGGPPDIPEPLLSRIESQAGPGLDPDRGVGMVFLPLEKYPVPEGMRRIFPLSMTLPVSFAAIIPGKGVTETFPGPGWVEHEKLEGVFVRGDDTYAFQEGPYIVIAPTLQTAVRLRGRQQSILTRLSAEELELLESHPIAAWGRMAVLGEMMDAIVARTSEVRPTTRATTRPAARPTTRTTTRTAGHARTTRPARGTVTRVTTQPVAPRAASRMFAALWGAEATVCLGVRIDADGVSVDGVLGCDEASLLGRGLRATEFADAPLIGRLPAARYALTGGAVNIYRAAPEKLRAYLAEQLEIGPVAAPATVKREYLDAMTALYGQVRRVRFYGGARPAMQGKLGAAVVLECDSAEAMRKALAAVCRTSTRLLGVDRDAPAFRYVRGDAGKPDVVRIEQTDLSGLDADERKVMDTLLGPDGLTLHLTQADAHTLVLTLGGEEGFVTQAVRAATGMEGGVRPRALAAALQGLPEPRVFVAALDVTGTWDALKSAIDATDPDADFPPLKLTTRVPLLAAGWESGGNLHWRIAAPREPIAQVIQAGVDAWTYETRKWQRDMPPPQPVPPGGP